MIRAGYEGYLYYNSATYGTPTWVLIAKAKNVALGLAMAESPGTRRSSGGFEETLPTLCQVSVEFDLFSEAGDSVFDDLMDAFFTRTPLDVLCVDRIYTDAAAAGVRFDAAVLTAPRDETIDAGMTTKFMLKPSAHGANAPVAWPVS